MMTGIEKLKNLYVQKRLNDAKKLKPFLTNCEYNKVVKRIKKSKFFIIPISAINSTIFNND